MGKHGSGDVVLFIGSSIGTFAFVGTATRSWGISLEVGQLDATVVTDNSERALAGARKDSFTWNGLFDDTRSIDSLMGLIGAAGGMQYMVFIGTVVPSVGYYGSGTALMAKPSSKIGELVAQSFEAALTTAFIHGSALAIRENVGSGTITGTVVNFGATSTSGGTAFFLIEKGATGDKSIGLEHATGSAGTWADLVSPVGISDYTGTDTLFSQITLVWAGTANQYIRYKKIGAGSMGGISILYPNP